MTSQRDDRAIRGPDTIRTRKRGIWLLKNPATNKGLAFTSEERTRFGLQGLLPSTVQHIDEQVRLELEHLREKTADLEKYIDLAGLLHRNEVLFYRVLVENLAELMPIVYTPTVGEACRRYSHIMRDVRGIWLTPDDRDRIPDRLRNFPYQDIRLIVVTDNERILGLGDQGAGGMGIPVGKLALYVAGAGIHPSKVMPISLDVGTDNPELLEDPLYVGYRERRIRGQAYDDFIEAFVAGVEEVFPRAVVQWEDFHKRNAFRILETYRRRIPCFNDDIQGTAAVAVAGILAGLRITGQPIETLRVVFMGAGEACTGIARLLGTAMREAGASEEQVRSSRFLFDRGGLLQEGRKVADAHKRELMVSREVMARWDFGANDDPSPEEVIRRVGANVLIGATAAPGTFRRAMIEALADGTERPIVMPLSNPTSKAECTAADAIAWSGGRALVATGSPFADVVHDGVRHVIGQSNNVFVFPGLGMGAMLAGMREIDDASFLVAARTLAELVSAERLGQGALFPDASELRTVSAHITTAVIRDANARQRGEPLADADLERIVEASCWWPAYVPVVPATG